MLSLRKLLFVSAIKQIAAQWFQLTSKSPSQAVIVISKPEMHYLVNVLGFLFHDYVLVQETVFFPCWLFFHSIYSSALFSLKRTQITPVSSLCSTRVPARLTPGGLLVTGHKECHRSRDGDDQKSCSLGRRQFDLGKFRHMLMTDPPITERFSIKKMQKFPHSTVFFASFAGE